MTDANIGHLLPLAHAQIGEGMVQTIDGRTLHSFLKVGKDFSTWIKDRIGGYGFIEGQDYVTADGLSSPVSGSAKARQQVTREYYLSLDMAKELAMLERNTEGKRARLYFIECERQAKASPVTEVMSDEEVLARGMLLAGKRIELLQAQVADLAPKANALDRIATADGDLCITDAAKALQKRPKDLFALMQQDGWIYKRPGGKHWLGYSNRVQSGLLTHKVTTIERVDGSEKIVEQVLITPKGLTKLAGIVSGPQGSMH